MRFAYNKGRELSSSQDSCGLLIENCFVLAKKSKLLYRLFVIRALIGYSLYTTFERLLKE